MSGDIKDLCCDISDIQNPMCWGCYVIWYEREHEIWVKENEEFFTQNGIEEIPQNHRLNTSKS